MLQKMLEAIAAFIAAGVDGLVLAVDMTAPADREPLKHILRVGTRKSGLYYAYYNIHRARVVNNKVTGDYGFEPQMAGKDVATVAETAAWLRETAELIAERVGDGGTLRTTYGRKRATVADVSDIRKAIDALRAAKAAHDAKSDAGKGKTAK